MIIMRIMSINCNVKWYVYWDFLLSSARWWWWTEADQSRGWQCPNLAVCHTLAIITVVATLPLHCCAPQPMGHLPIATTFALLWHNQHFTFIWNDPFFWIQTRKETPFHNHIIWNNETFFLLNHSWFSHSRLKMNCAENIFSSKVYLWTQIQLQILSHKSDFRRNKD